MTPGQNWLDNLPLGDVNSRGYGIINGEVGGVLNPFVNIDANGTLRAMSAYFDELEHVRYFDVGDSRIKAVETSLTAYVYNGQVITAVGIAYDAGGLFLHNTFQLDQVTFKLNVLP